MFMIPTIIQTIVFIAYVMFLWIKFKGPLPSISESWYRLNGGWKSLFTFFCWGIAFPMCFQTNGTTGLFFLSGAGIGFVGAATMFRSGDKTTTWVHFIGAVTCIIAALAGIFFERGYILPFLIWAVVSILIELFKVKNAMWWIELSAFIAIIYGLTL